MKSHGFSMLETISVLIITSIMITSIVAVSPTLINSKKDAATKEDLTEIKKALIGSARSEKNSDIVSFGFFGDMGTLPSNLDNLTEKLTSQSTHNVDNDTKIGLGWRKHITSNFENNFHTKDRFSNEYIWSVDLNNSDIVATITSKGADGTLGTSDDIVVEIKRDEVFAQISGVVKDKNDNVVADTTVTINYPSSENISSISTTSDNTGQYSFTDIPFGVRSLSFEGPGLHSFSTEAEIDNNDSSLKFSITNLSRSSFSIDQLSIVANTSPAIYFEEIVIGGNNVFQAIPTAANRQATDGSTANFTAAYTLSGITSSEKVNNITIKEKDTILDDIVLGDDTGDSVTIVIKGFYEHISSTTANKATLEDVPLSITIGNSFKTYTFTIIGDD